MCKLTYFCVCSYTTSNECVEHDLLPEVHDDGGDFGGVCEGDARHHHALQVSTTIHTVHEVLMCLVR